MEIPLIYACSGCTLTGCRAYLVAKELDERGLAQMSCLAGVAAGKSGFLKELRGRRVWVVDGCDEACGRAVIENLVPVSWHISLDKLRTDKVSISTEAMVDHLLKSKV